MTERALAVLALFALGVVGCGTGADPGPHLADACRAWAEGDTAAAAAAAEEAEAASDRWADLVATLRGDADPPAVTDVVEACRGVRVDPDDDSSALTVVVAARRNLAASGFTPEEAGCLGERLVGTDVEQVVSALLVGAEPDALGTAALEAVFDCVAPDRRLELTGG